MSGALLHGRVHAAAALGSHPQVNPLLARLLSIRGLERPRRRWVRGQGRGRCGVGWGARLSKTIRKKIRKRSQRSGCNSLFGFLGLLGLLGFLGVRARGKSENFTENSLLRGSLVELSKKKNTLLGLLGSL